MELSGNISFDKAAGRVCLSLLPVNIVSRFGTWDCCSHLATALIVRGRDTPNLAPWSIIAPKSAILDGCLNLTLHGCFHVNSFIL